MENLTAIQVQEKLQDLGLGGFLKFLAEKSNINVGYSGSHYVAKRSPETKVIGDHYMDINGRAILTIFEYDDRYDLLIEINRISKEDDTRENHIEFTKNIFDRLRIDAGDSVIEPKYRSAKNPAAITMGGQITILKQLREEKHEVC